jgi:hypothetical protein
MFASCKPGQSSTSMKKGFDIAIYLLDMDDKGNNLLCTKRSAILPNEPIGALKMVPEKPEKNGFIRLRKALSEGVF